jgi:hypothetical protein
MAAERSVKIKFTGDAKGLAAAAKIAERSVSKFREGVESAGRMAVPAAATAAAVLGAAMAPALAASLAAGMSLALGGGVLLAGIMSAAKDPGVTKAFGELKKRAEAAFKDFGKPFIEPLKRVADTLGDGLERMAPSLNKLSAAMAPVIDKIVPGLVKMAENALPGIIKGAESSIPLFEMLGEDVLPKVGEWIGKIVTKVAEFTTWAIKNASTIKSWITTLTPIIGIFLGIIAAIKVWIAVQAALNVVMSLNPIGLVVIAIAALVAIVIVIEKRTGIFSRTFKAAWSGIKSAASAVGTWFRDTLYGRYIKGAFNSIVDKGRSVLSWFKSLPGKIGSFLSSIGDKIANPFRAAFSSIARLWNNTVGQLSFTVPDWVPGIGGNGWTAPKLPERRWGGPVSAGQPYMVGEKGPELFMPSSSGRIVAHDRLGGEQTINLAVDLSEGITQVFQIKIDRNNRQTVRALRAR